MTRCSNRLALLLCAAMAMAPAMGGELRGNWQSYWLAHSAAHPGLLDNKGNIALLLRAQEAGLLPDHVGARAADAYRELRRAQHRARLDEQPTQVDPETLAEHRDAVLALWRTVFG